jgi:hypothetical protein
LRGWEGVKFGRWEVERVRRLGGNIEAGMGKDRGQKAEDRFQRTEDKG